MSHPDPTRNYGENEYPSDSPQKDGFSGSSHGRALAKAKKVPRMSDTVKGWAKKLRKVIKDNK